MTTARIEIAEGVRSAAKMWWLGLVIGIIAVLYGLFVLSLRPASITSLAILAGISFIFGGIGQFGLAQLVQSGRWLFYVGGVLGILAGILAFAWPDITIFVLAVFVSWYLVIGGIFIVVGAFSGPKYDLWWTRIILGALMFVLGAWAIGSPEHSVSLFVNLIGFYLLLYGFTEIMAAFAVRSLGENLDATAEADTNDNTRRQKG
jgi:uncharacterized membrane protein HdeD (DUF308 family)